MVKDPICGAYVAVASSVSVRDGETVHRFCSYECRDAYLERLRDAGREIPQHRKSEDE
jgi:YHS domain-containing protein